MSTLLDEETILLEGLDFEIPCSAKVDHTADVSVLCRGCGSGAMYCAEHAEAIRRNVDLILAASPLGVVACAHCKRVARSFDELAKVVPL